MKRIFDTRSKSAETLAMVNVASFGGVPVEPQCKKQRQSVIKQSVKRLFGSVKRLLPTSHRRKDKVGLEEATGAFFMPHETVKKSAAIQEAEAFLARLSSDWTIAQVKERIDYLYRLVNDAFERSYQQTLQDKTINGPSQNVKDYMTEIRRLQAMIAERQVIEAADQVHQDPVHRGSLSLSADDLVNIPNQRSCSVDNCHPAQSVQPQFDFAVVTPGFTRPFSPAPPSTCIQPIASLPRHFTEGMEHEGVRNNVQLSLYNLSLSRANVPQQSASNAEIQPPVIHPELQYYEPVYEKHSKDEEMECIETSEFEEKIQMFERISRSALCSIGSIGHERQHTQMSLPSLSRPRSFEQSQDQLVSNHAHHQSLGCIPIGHAVLQLLSNQQTETISQEFLVVDHSDCSSRKCSVRELAKMFENTTI